jgi:hypothetical protein
MSTDSKKHSWNWVAALIFLALLGAYVGAYLFLSDGVLNYYAGGVKPPVHVRYFSEDLRIPDHVLENFFWPAERIESVIRGGAEVEVRVRHPRGK